MITGLNHVTLAVTDLERSFDFYVGVLGCMPVARWAGGAYLDAGGLWLALHVDARVRDAQRPDYSHIAFGCAPGDFAGLAAALEAAGCRAWSDNRSEGDSVYFEDPDGHKLEIHVGDLDSRLAAMKAAPWAPTAFFDRNDESA